MSTGGGRGGFDRAGAGRAGASGEVAAALHTRAVRSVPIALTMEKNLPSTLSCPRLTLDARPVCESLIVMR